MTTFALFVCLTYASHCQRVDPSDYGTLAECEHMKTTVFRTMATDRQVLVCMEKTTPAWHPAD